MSDNKVEQNRTEPAPTNWAAGKEEILQREIDADEALQVVTGYNADAIQLDAETERRLLRKIDRNLMPVLLRPMFA